MTERDIYERLGEHLSRLGMGYPYREDLIDILKENFSPEEAEVALAVPNRAIPLKPVGVDEINRSSALSREELTKVLESLAARGLLFSAKTDDDTHTLVVLPWSSITRIEIRGLKQLPLEFRE